MIQPVPVVEEASPPRAARRPREAPSAGPEPDAGPPDAYGLSRSAPEEIGEEAVRSRIISPSLLLPAEVVLFELKPSLWYVLFASLPIAAAGVALVVLALAVEQLQSVRHLGMVIGMWVIGLRVAIALLQWLGRTYVLTDRRILIQSGVFDVRVEALGLEQIETTFVAQAVVQRLLGIGTIFFRTGNAGRGSLSWEHVRRPKEVHGHVVTQIERWKHALEGKGQG
jgi:hypothetical protein